MVVSVTPGFIHFLLVCLTNPKCLKPRFTEATKANGLSFDVEHYLTILQILIFPLTQELNS